MEADQAPETLDNGAADLLSLPPGWLWVNLGDIADVTMGNSPPGSSYNEVGHGLPLINGPTEFGPGALDSPRQRQFTDEFSRTCMPGDLLICVRGSTTGRTNVASFEAAIGRGVASIRAFELQPYLNHYVWSRSAALLAISSGSTFPSISIAQLRALAVPLPPLDEQAHIVTAIEDAMTDIDAGIDRLSNARADLTRLRAAVLRAALSGDLTAAYRSADKGLEDDLSQQAAPSQPSVERAKQASLFDHNPKVRSDREEESSLPGGWHWTTFGDVCDVRLGRSKSPSNRAGKFATPYLRAANITEDGLQLTDVLTMDFPPREQELYRLRAGDLIVAEASGSSSQVGKPAMWLEELPLCCYQNTVIRLRPFAMEPAFVLVALQHCYFNGVFSGLSAGVGINHLGASRLHRIEIPMPPVAEQSRISQEVKDQLETMSHSRRTIDRALKHAEQLRRSVWKQAFSGLLVKPSQDKNSAKTLLSSVRARLEIKTAEKLAARPSAKGRRQKDRPMRISLHQVLLDHPEGLSPERLFALGGYAGEQVDEFYAELGSLSERLVEERPADVDILQWPRAGEIILRLKEG